MQTKEIDGVLLLMAEDAFDVLNWARREGFKKDKQLEQVVSAYRKSLSDTKARIVVDDLEVVSEIGARASLE